ncbi:hypothetical protein NL676_004821 [Syzygium grande]|nr:hypothetical protein NL676_004821 [Syzygium grande]
MTPNEAKARRLARQVEPSDRVLPEKMSDGRRFAAIARRLAAPAKLSISASRFRSARPQRPLLLRSRRAPELRSVFFGTDMGQIQYSEKYFDDTYEYRHVVLPPDVAKLLPKNRLLSENEWRAIGVQQSRGWVHYAIHRPEPHIMLFRRPLNYQQQQENQAQQTMLAK